MGVKRILIIDDDDELAGELRETLSLNGYEAFSISDAAAALQEAVSIKPDLILLDVKMPGKNGFHLADEIRRDPSLVNSMVVFMTAFFREEYVPLMNMCDIKNCIQKPFNPVEIISRIKMLIGE